MNVSKFSKMLYFNSEQNSLLDSRLGQYNIPSQLLSYKTTDQLQLTVNDFYIEKTFYDINQTNNTFFLGDKTANANKLFKIEITPQNFPFPKTFDDAQILTAIGDAINIQLVNAGSAVTVAASVSTQADANLKLIVLEFDNDLEDEFDFYSFATKNIARCSGTLLNAISPFASTVNDALNNDSSELLGGNPVRERDLVGKSELSQLEPMFQKTSSKTMQSYFPFTPNTIRELYLRTQSLVSSSALEVVNLSQASDDQVGEMISSDILFKIAIDDLSKPSFSYIDANNNYSAVISPSLLSQINFALTDSRGRLMFQISKDNGRTPSSLVTQARSGNVYFSFSLKVEVISNDSQ